MEEQSGDTGSKRYRALRDRYPAAPEAQARLAQDEVRVLRQAVGELSAVVGALVAYLVETSRQPDSGAPRGDPTARVRLRSLLADIDALRERLLDS